MCWRERTKSLSNGSTLLNSKDKKKKITVLTLCAMLFALCSFADAQQPKKVPRIGYLSPRDPASESSRSETIRLALRELG